MSRLTIDVRMLHASGIGTYIRNLVPAVAAGLAGWRTTVLGDPADADEWRALLPDASWRPVDAPIYSLREQREVWRATPADTRLFWAPHYNVPGLVRCPLLVTVHDLAHLALREIFHQWHRRAYAHAMFGIVRRRAAAVLCPSAFTRDEFERLVPGRAIPVHVTHLGVDDAWRAATPSVTPARPYFVYVGNVKPHKNLATLLDAFSRLVPELPHDLVIVGRREGFLTSDDALGGHVSRLGARLQFTGHLSSAELRERVAGATALVFPSLYEGFGLPPLEAMAAGCPVVASRRASIPEVCGDAAVLVDALDAPGMAVAMRAVATDDALRARLMAAGRRRAAGFTWRGCADATLRALAPLFAGARA